MIRDSGLTEQDERDFVIAALFGVAGLVTLAGTALAALIGLLVSQTAGEILCLLTLIASLAVMAPGVRLALRRP